MNKKGFINYVIPAMMLVFASGIGFLLLSFLLLNIYNDVIESTKECEELYPTEEFCEFDITCGYKCKEVALDFFHAENGGIFSTSSCTCINQETKEVVRLY